MKKIAVSGIGIVAPAGTDKEDFWRNVASGRSFVSPITHFDASAYPSQIAGQVGKLDLGNLSPRLLKKLDRFSVLALVATGNTLRDAGIEVTKEDPYSIGIFLGNALGGWLYAETELRDLYVEGRAGVSPYMASAWFPAAPQGQVSIHYGIKGYSKTVVSDKASSLMAVGHAAKVIGNHNLKFALAGGTEAPVTPYALLCCSTEGSLSRGPYRPFDKARDGFVVGEGAAVVVLEDVDSARARGAHIHGLVTGFATFCDATDRIMPDPEGKGLARAIGGALAGAGYQPDDIDYISADGIATRLGDSSETRAIKDVFGTNGHKIPVSAPKSMFGHLLGASGAVDLVTTLLAMQHGVIPPTINHETPDDECDLDYVFNKSREHRIDKALVISRGRGGVNTVLTVERS
ncbi:MAG: beta-ketoacyl-[acyl-carrier-protein] synthase family protein [Dehalococcoidales bacterium]|nr:beta-ketoacyl-[acyl-carrier-protein] synthase family protein [Dehalococcoidales bacterium]